VINRDPDAWKGGSPRMGKKRRWRLKICRGNGDSDRGTQPSSHRSGGRSHAPLIRGGGGAGEWLTAWGCHGLLYHGGGGVKGGEWAPYSAAPRGGRGWGSGTVERHDAHAVSDGSSPGAAATGRTMWVA
jgi:hypothetical protein